MKKCIYCDKGEYDEIEVRDYKYLTPMGYVTIEGDSQFLKCDHCSQVLIPGTLYEKWNKLILEGLIKKSGPIDNKELQFILSVLPYSQNQIAERMGKERSTLTHYKSGKNPIDRLFDFTLRKIIVDFLEGNSKTMDDLKQTFEFQNESTGPRARAR